MKSLALLIPLIAIGLVSPEAISADRIVLRNLQIISDQTVTGMTVDGLTLSGGAELGWDEIEGGRVAGKQELFDKYVSNLGIHLYRIRQRLGVGDYAGLLTHAEEVAKYYAGRPSKTGYMVMQALMWGRLAAGQRESAVEPYLYCLEYLRARPTEKIDLPGQRRLKFDAVTGMSDELPPIWFDSEAAKAALPNVSSAVGKMKEPRPAAARIYYASLAQASGDAPLADRALLGLDETNARVAQLKTIFAAEREVLAGKPGNGAAKLAASVETFEPSNQALGRYWLGRSLVERNDPQEVQEGTLKLLYVPALFGATQPELAAASLYAAMQSLEKTGDVRGSIAVRKELMTKFGQSWHAKAASAETPSARRSPTSKPAG